MSATAADVRVIEPLDAPVDASLTLPGSKSLTNRALLAAALAPGTSTLRGALVADDTQAMRGCLGALGAVITEGSGDATTLEVEGTGGGLRPGPIDLDARQSGTTARFVLPVLGLGVGSYRLDGHAQLRGRPMRDGVDALRTLGATVHAAGVTDHLPIDVRGGPVSGGEVHVAADASSQFLSGLLLAAPIMRDGLVVHVDGELVSRPYVDMTVAVIGDFDGEVETPDASTWIVAPKPYVPASYDIEPDASAASYFFAAAALTGSRVTITGLGSRSVQGDVAFVDVLERMGARVERTPDHISVQGTGTLRGIDADLADLSDTAPTLAVVAAYASEPTEVRGVGFIRRKESDRIGAVVRELQRAGIDAAETDDGFVVHPGAGRPATSHTDDDHRMAMSFALLGLRSPGIAISGPGCVAKTFPGYWDSLESLRQSRHSR